MKKRLLSLMLALVLIIGMLPVTTIAAATRYRVTLMYGTDYALQVWASNEGEVTYTKNKEVTFTDSEGTEFTGWVQENVEITDEQTEEWNTKYYYDSAAGQCVLVLKGAKLDSYNNPAQKAVSSSYAIYGLNVYNSHSLRIEIMEDSIMEATTIVLANGTADSKLKDLEVISHGNAKLSCDTKGYFAYMQASFVKLNANIEYNGNGNSFLYLNKSGGYYQIDGGHLKVSAYRFTAHSNSSYPIYLNGGSLDVTTTNRFAYSPVKYAEGLCYTAKNASGTSLNLTGGNSSKRVIVETYESHVLTGEFTDCTAGGTCATCGATVAGRAAHEAAADDDNCVTAITCKYCDVVMVEGNAEHEPGEPSGNCAVAVTCKNCSFETTPAKEHTPKDPVIENETDKDYESVVYCSVCEKEVSRETVSKLCPHTNNNLLSQVDPTCTVDGVAYRYCNDCQENYEEVLPATGHDHVAGTPVAPTINAQGYTPYICNSCGDTYNSDFVDVLWAAACIGEQGFNSLKEAVEAAQDGDTIILRKNMKTGDAVYIDKNITINFNGHYYCIDKPYEGAAMVIAPNVVVTLKDTRGSNSGKFMVIYSNAEGICSKNFNYLIKNNGTLYVENLILNGNNLHGAGDTYTIENTGTIYLNKGTIVNARVNALNPVDGSVTKAADVSVKAPTGYHFDAETGILEKHSYAESLVEPTVYEIAYLVYTCDCGDNYRIYLTGTKKLPAIAKNTETGILYASVQEAVDAARNGQVIEMLDKVQYGKTLTIPEGKNITIDMKGFYYAVKQVQGGAAVIVEEGAELNLISAGTSGAVKAEYASYKDFYSVIDNSGTVTIENVVINGNNLFNEGSSAIVNNGLVTLKDDTKINIRKNDKRVTEFGGEGEINDQSQNNAPLADLSQMANVILDKSASAGNALTVHPGSNITYTITIINNNDTAISVNVVDTLPNGTAFVSGCDDVRGTSLYWSEKNIAPGEVRTITYTVKADYTLAQIRANKEDTVIKNTAAKVITTVVPAPEDDIWVLETFNKEDIRKLKMGINALVTANLNGNKKTTPYNGLTLISAMYTAGFTCGAGFGTTDPDEVLNMVYDKSGQGGSSSGAGGAEDVTDTAVNLLDRVVPTLYGGTAVPAEKDSLFRGERATNVTVDNLITGDVIFANNDGVTKAFIYDGTYLVEVSKTNVTTNIAPESVLATLPESDRYVVIRPSTNLNITYSLNEGEYFNKADKEGYTDLEKALIATAEAYLLRGDRTQYTDDSTGTSTNRAQSTLKQPEDYTVDQYGYTNCAYFTYDVHWATYGVAAQATLSSTGKKQIQSTTTYLADAAKYKWDPVTKTGGNKSTIFYCEPMVKDADGKYVSNMTAEEQAEVKQYIYDNLRPGDIICIRRQSGSGHAMLYVGNGTIIHSSGSNYSRENNADTHEASIRFRMVADLFDPAIYNSTSYVFNLVSFSIVRLQNLTTDPTISENTKNRVDNMKGIVGEKIASTSMGKTVSPGDEITYTFFVNNTNEEAKQIAIRDVLSEHVTFVSATNDAAVSGSNISWDITVPAHTRMEITYTVKVNEGVATYTCIDGSKATINGVSHKCINTYVANTLTAEQQQKIVEAVETVKGMEGVSELNSVEIANLIYKTAFGIENLFGEEVTSHSLLVNGNPTNTVAKATNNIGIFNDSTYWGSSNTTTVAFKDDNTSNASKMVAPGMFGGGLVYTTSNEPSTRYTYANGSTLRARLFWEKDLVIGDLFVMRGSSTKNNVTTYYEQMYIYTGNDTFVSIGNTFNLFSEKSVYERFQIAPNISTFKYLAVLRPSIVFEEI